MDPQRTSFFKVCSALQEAGIIVTITDSASNALRLTIPKTMTCVVSKTLLIRVLEQSNSMSEFVESIRLGVLFNG
jgi:hypothetical protein